MKKYHVAMLAKQAKSDARKAARQATPPADPSESSPSPDDDDALLKVKRLTGSKPNEGPATYLALVSGVSRSSANNESKHCRQLAEFVLHDFPNGE